MYKSATLAPYRSVTQRRAEDKAQERTSMAMILGTVAVMTTFIVTSMTIGDNALKAKTRQAVQGIKQAAIYHGTVNDLEGGEATVTLGNGKYLRISSPILTQSGVVLEHARGKAAEQQDATPYVSQAGGDFGNVANITFSDHGKSLSEAQAFADTQLVPITDPGVTSTHGNAANYFVAPSGAHIAQGVLEHEVTMTELVPYAAQ